MNIKMNFQTKTERKRYYPPAMRTFVANLETAFCSSKVVDDEDGNVAGKTNAAAIGTTIGDSENDSWTTSGGVTVTE